MTLFDMKMTTLRPDLSIICTSEQKGPFLLHFHVKITKIILFDTSQNPYVHKKYRPYTFEIISGPPKPLKMAQKGSKMVEKWSKMAHFDPLSCHLPTRRSVRYP